jgi:hypothetical protein
MKKTGFWIALIGVILVCSALPLLLLRGGELGGTLSPCQEPLDRMEEKLTMVYGGVSLCRCSDRRGRSRLVMLSEEDGV